MLKTRSLYSRYSLERFEQKVGLSHMGVIFHNDTFEFKVMKN